ncbi:hypothetical protein [Candidatus Deferrimicrobium sp.]|uniref:hypothetical protein n=1 Tax=Candidatus Deferrimicrobium sp. TaxID=3060586 RepID=UPI002ED1FAB4
MRAFIIKKSRAVLLACLASALALPGLSNAETRTLTWNAVSTYSDGTPIESNVYITYNMYWSSDAGLSPGSLNPLVSSAVQTTYTFDPDLVGMPRGTTFYLTGETVLSTGEKSLLTPAISSTLPNLSELFIGCPSSLNEGETGVCTATALWSDGSMTPVLPAWSGGSPYASIGADGVLTAGTVTGDQSAIVTAGYTNAGVTRTTTATVMIVDLSVVTIMAPKNVNVSGPLADSPSLPIRLAWDPVATYTDGTPIPSGAIVDYSAYWTSDSTLSESSLIPLASTTPSLSVYFDPTTQGMKRNQRVYFTTRAMDSTGKKSHLSASVPWKVSNSGLSSPNNGRIKKN